IRQSASENVGQGGCLVIGASDVDVFRFVAPTAGDVFFRTITSNENSADTFLRLFDASGNELARNDDANPNTTASLIAYRVVAGQTYYIGVDGFSLNAGDYDPVTGAGAVPGSTGTYVLTLSQPVNAIFVT